MINVDFAIGLLVGAALYWMIHEFIYFWTPWYRKRMAET